MASPVRPSSSLSLLQRFPLLSVPLPLLASSCSLLSIPTLVFTLSPMISSSSPQWRRVKRALKLRVKALLIDMRRKIESMEEAIHIEKDEGRQEGERARSSNVEHDFAMKESREKRSPGEPLSEVVHAPNGSGVNANHEPESPVKSAQPGQPSKEGEYVSSPLTDMPLSSSFTDPVSTTSAGASCPPSSESSSSPSPLLPSSAAKSLISLPFPLLSNSSICPPSSAASAGLSYSALSQLFGQLRALSRQHFLLTFLVSQLYSTLQEIRKRDPFVDVVIKEHFQKNFPPPSYRKRSIASAVEISPDKQTDGSATDNADGDAEALRQAAAKTEAFFLSSLKSARMKPERRGGRRRMRSIDEDESELLDFDSAQSSRRPSESETRGSDAANPQF